MSATEALRLTRGERNGCLRCSMSLSRWPERRSVAWHARCTKASMPVGRSDRLAGAHAEGSTTRLRTRVPIASATTSRRPGQLATGPWLSAGGPNHLLFDPRPGGFAHGGSNYPLSRAARNR